MSTRDIGSGVGRHVLLTMSNDMVAIMTRAASHEFDEGGIHYRFIPFPDQAFVEAEIAKWRPTAEEREMGRTGWCDGIEFVRHRVIHTHEIPTQRFYRGAWCERDGAIVHDMERAREIHRTKIRAVRELVFRPLDAAYMCADEEGMYGETRKGVVVAQKQILRDLPNDPRIDAAQTIEELFSLWPFGKPADVLVMARRAIERGVQVA